MQLLAALCYLIALLPVGLSAVQPPEYFLIRSKVILRGSKEYYKLYLSSYPNGDESYTPIFLKTYQGGVQFFSLTKPRTTGNTTFYSLELARDQPTIAKMAYDVSRYAFWQPLIFNTIEKNAQPTEMQTGFYIDGEGKDMQLMWTDQVEAVPGISKGWLVCDWWLNYPQLFFATISLDILIPPVSCAPVILQVIPLSAPA